MPFRNSAYTTGAALLLLLVLIVAPFVYGTAHRVEWPETPGSNDGSILELDVLHATEFRQRLGPYSRFQVNHPGPLYFYLAAPFYAHFEHETFGVNMAAALIKTMCLAGILFLLLRFAQPAFAFAAMIGLAATQLPAWNAPLHIDAAYPWNSLYNIWTPALVLLPALLLQFVAALFAAGRLSMIVPAVFLGSLAVQSHLSAVPAVLAAGATGALLYVLQRPSARITPEEVRWGLFALFTALLVWMPPLHEELTESPGNLTKLIALALHGAPELSRPGFDTVLATLIAKLASFPMLPYLLLSGRSHEPGVLLEGGAFLAATIIVAVELVLLGYAILRHHLDGRRFERYLALITAVMIVFAGYSVANIRGEPYDYLYDWMMYAGFLLTLCAVGGLLAGRDLPATLIFGGMILVTVAASYNITHFARGDYFGRTSDRAASAAQVRDYLDGHAIENAVVYMPPQGFEHWNYYAEWLLLLVREGRDVRVESRVGFMFGRALVADPAVPPNARLLFTNEAGFAETKRVFPELELVAKDGPVWIGAVREKAD